MWRAKGPLSAGEHVGKLSRVDDVCAGEAERSRQPCEELITEAFRTSPIKVGNTVCEQRSHTEVWESEKGELTVTQMPLFRGLVWLQMALGCHHHLRSPE